ncbi:hypothetical protein [Gordonia oryzae]|uniref:hypothetical protein n=1 Tax=Gordonia oryzae TaxID=2487349 RepID=UPI0016150305|nr:hypothetical protein [Gordonia oryzae]
MFSCSAASIVGGLPSAGGAGRRRWVGAADLRAAIVVVADAGFEELDAYGQRLHHGFEVVADATHRSAVELGDWGKALRSRRSTPSPEIAEANEVDDDAVAVIDDAARVAPDQSTEARPHPLRRGDRRVGVKPTAARSWSVSGLPIQGPHRCGAGRCGRRSRQRRMGPTWWCSASR